jgi:hypothetical protein
MGRRAKIVAEIERQVSKLNDQPGLCLYYAHHTASVLWRHCLPAVIQAGSLQWPRVRRDEDDGRIDTHFAYMWSPGAADSALSVALGNLPEMHVWIGLLESQEIVDFTTRHLRRAAEDRGLAWSAADPPRYLWCPADAMPDWVVYRPDRDASIYACTILQRLFHPVYLQRQVRR